MANYIIQESTLTGLADQVRRIKSISGKLTTAQLLSNLQSITLRTSSNLSASGATVTVPAGYYASQATKSVTTATRASTTITTAADDTADTLTLTASNNQSTGYVTGSNKTATKTITLTASGAAVTASDGSTSISKSVTTATQATPAATINSSTGLVTASATQTAGYVYAGTKSSTLQLSTQAAKTVTPSTSEQTAVAANTYTLGAVKVAAIPTVGRASTTISTSANSSAGILTLTASNNQGTGYVTGSNQTATKTVTLSISDATATASDGSVSVSKTIPSTKLAQPTITLGATGLITASVTQNTSGYISAGEKSSTRQLATQEATTITPSTSEQTAVATNVYTLGDIKVAAIPSTYKNTNDADAAEDDIVINRTAYVNGSKLTGTNPYEKSTTDSEVHTQSDLITDLQTILSGKVAGSGSSDTSDATAQPTDIVSGKTAYARGSKITGALEEEGYYDHAIVDMAIDNNGKYVFSGIDTDSSIRKVYTYGAVLRTEPSAFGNATAADVMAGKTFTSSTGLNVTGTGALLETEPAPAYEFVLVYNDRESWGYGFTKSTAAGYTDYYESENKGDSAASSVSTTSCYFNVWTPCTVTFSVMNSGESNYDYGLASALDTQFNSTNSNAAYNFKGTLHTTPTTITYTNVPVGQHVVYFRYIKDGSVNNNDDCFRFKLEAAPNTAAVLTDSSKEMVRAMEHQCKPYNIAAGTEILGVTGTYDNSISNCSITTSGFLGYHYWTKANYSSLIMQMTTVMNNGYTMNNVACGSIFAVYCPSAQFNTSQWSMSNEIALISASGNWAVFAAPDTANYSGYITWNGSVG